MDRPNPQDQVGDEKITQPKSRRAVGVVVYTLAALMLFVVGCFVIGPALSRIRPARTIKVQAPQDQGGVESSDPPSVDRKPTNHTRPTVVITVRPAEETKPIEKTVPKSTSVSTQTTPETEALATSGASDNNASVTPPTMETPDSPPVETDEPDKTTAQASLYRVRAGIFADRANADTLAARLSSAGFAPAVYQVRRDSAIMFSVQLGAFRKRESADKLAQGLRNAGFEATITTDK